ncbi:hypothetical protein [Hymenobacter cellulosivorans]|uniref:Uncharacterized protein n=1 Tax=Hymenobacter cellulosivorans TaxID=2932249 RepID=A0ABY4FIK2_9BACT|nr:hypothetical protein [Hymenobacter cellulosivorans]UOQ54296.1 hypothetical protein MUN80_05940 [Hymenobacter cellulosivorans]
MKKWLYPLLITGLLLAAYNTLLVTGLLLGSKPKQHQGRAHLYELKISEQVRWHVDNLAPIPDSFVVVANVYAQRGKPTRYVWAPYGRERFGQLIQQPTDTLAAQVSDSLYNLVQHAFYNVPTDADQQLSGLQRVADFTDTKLEVSTIVTTLSITTQGYKAYEPVLFLLRQSHNFHK